jgi:type VI secretion system protein ImpK
LPLIELKYLLISLGFEGKYRIIANGMNALENVRLELYQLIQRLRGDADPDLSVRWLGTAFEKHAIARHIPLWVLASILGALLLATYIGFAIAINGASDLVYRQFLALAKDDIKLATTAAVAPVVTKTIAPARVERFKRALAEEIGKNMVEVVDDRILRIRNSFASGSDQIKPEFLIMIRKIAQELEAGQDSVLVTGHTDDKPIVSARFPSNWHLSKARALHVLETLQSSASISSTSRFEGRGDGEPLAPNDSAEHRALNRRVDILVK